MPLCAVVHVADEDWARAVETLLGAGRDAVLVEREQVRPAVRLIRRDRSSFYDCTIVQVSGMEQFGGKPKPDSLAAVVETDDPRARAFVNQRLGGITRVRTEAELETARRAVTQDCQYASGGGIQNRRPVADLILGRRWDDADIARLTVARDQAMETWASAQRRQRTVSEAVSSLASAASALPAAEQVSDLIDRSAEADRAITDAAEALELAERSLPADLEEQVSDLTSELAERETERKEIEQEKEVARSTLARSEAALGSARQALADA